MNDIPFDSISFGNPSAKDQLIILRESYLDKVLPELLRYTPPKNSSAATKNEINKLVDYVNSKRVVKNNLYDEGLLKMIRELFVSAGAEEEFVKTVSDGIAEDVIPILTKLKYYFNRPRPAQLSYYYDINFFPDFSFFTNNPSYPSSHTCLTAVTAHVLGNLYPSAFDRVQKLVKEVNESRLYLGVHYPSDNDMSMVVARKILENPEFKMKYRL